MSDIFASVARVARPSADDALLLRVRERAGLEPEAFDELKPFLFSAEISNRKLDAYFTRMAVSTLRNFAEDAEGGVSFQNSHNCYELGFGRSVRGTYEGDDKEGRVVADFYTVPGLSLNGVSTDNLIAGIRTGLVSDVSVGFYGGRHVCDICGFSVMDWENCRHYPGTEAEVVDPKDPKRKITVTATATVEDARLAEVSAVYDGATPGAVILKAQQASEAGRLNPKQARLLEQRYRINLPGSRKVFAGVGEGRMKENEEKPGEGEQPEAERALETVRSVAKSVGLSDDFKSPAEGARLLADEVKRLKPLADDGKQYRADLVEEALREGVRAHGERFKGDDYKRTLEAAPIETIKLMRDDWKRTADLVLQGGRATVDGEEPKAPAADIVPSGVYS